MVKVKYSSNEHVLVSNIDTGNAGIDIRALLEKDVILEKNKIYIIPTGIALEMPYNIEAQVRSRSGLAKEGIIILNSPGTIDPSYRGEIFIIMTNLSEKPYTIKNKDRIAQLVFSEYKMVEFEKIDAVSFNTKRNDKGLGSSGII